MRAKFSFRFSSSVFITLVTFIATVLFAMNLYQYIDEMKFWSDAVKLRAENANDMIELAERLGVGGRGIEPVLPKAKPRSSTLFFIWHVAFLCGCSILLATISINSFIICLIEAGYSSKRLLCWHLSFFRLSVYWIWFPLGIFIVASAVLQTFILPLF